VVATLLQVNPRHRPSVDQLCQMPLMRRHIPELGGAGPEFKPTDLLSTIKLPANAIDISGMLPQARYDLPKVLDEGMSDDGAGGTRGSGRSRGMQRSPRQYSRAELDALPKPLGAPGVARGDTGATANSVQRDQDGRSGSPRGGSYVPSHSGEHDALDALRKQHQRALPPVSRQPSGSHEDSELPPVQPRLYQPRSEASSLAGPSQAGRAVEGRGRYNPRPQGYEARRPMAQYARQQYSLGSQQGGGQQRPQ
ncbi:unnamed protein product, partial [Prorocentrum cordatum]